MTQSRTEERPAEFAKLLTYLQSTAISLPVEVTDPADMPPVAPPVDPREIEAEIDQLPGEQRLHTHRQRLTAYFGSHAQLSATVKEITRLRELTFRAFEEGSGQEVDVDEFDATYLHLFVWDARARLIVGGYRLGQTDRLLESYGTEGVYLGSMFEFEDSFYEGSAMLEIGRSFVVPEYQKAHTSLYMLWCGIGRFLVMNPQYRRLYGVVSMSRLYDSRTMAAIRDALLEPSSEVRAKSAYEPDLGAEWRDYLASNRPMAMRDVSRIVRALEDDQRDVPVLIRHYHKLGARFVSAAVDSNFNNTPGLLLCLDVPSIPAKYLNQYFGEGLAGYLDYGT
ncbi:MAG: GNAT family N-acetyltransferase [Gammaproteobacteria bacterium]|nr:GNAT family N-acetyltransferase [Gammaproteobacteria bacterium]